MRKSDIKDILANLAKSYQIHDKNIVKALDLINSVEVPERLFEMSFIIMTPDSVYNQIIRDVVEYICEKADCKIIAAKLRYLSDYDIEELYRYTYQSKIVRNERTFWWLSRLKYKNTPCVALIFYNPKSEKQFFCEKLLEMKGSYAIATGYKGETVRERFKALNRIISILHSSDDILALLRESLLFFDYEELSKLFSGVSINNFLSIETITDLTFPNINGNILQAMSKRLNATLKITNTENYYLQTAKRIITTPDDYGIPLTEIGYTVRKADICLSEWDEIYLLNKLYFDFTL